MTDEQLPPAAPAPAPLEKAVHDTAARAFAAHAAEAHKPGGRVRSIWARRVEPWLALLAAVGLVGWALARMFLSR